MNVISNAIKFMEQGGLTISFVQKIKNDKIILELNVRDTGIGMTPDEAKKVSDILMS